MCWLGSFFAIVNRRDELDHLKHELPRSSVNKLGDGFSYRVILIEWYNCILLTGFFKTLQHTVETSERERIRLDINL